jgi:chaperonin GroEL (HSP60 family)
MENIIDLIATDSSPAEISDGIKAALFAKSAEKIDQIRPYVANAMFGVEDVESEDELEYDDNQDQEEE